MEYEVLFDGEQAESVEERFMINSGQGLKYLNKCC